MASRKSSSRKSSSTKSKSSSINGATTSTQAPLIAQVMSLLFIIVYQGIILTYVINLEDKLCNCIRDWRHDFMKYFSIIMIVWSLILFIITLNGIKNPVMNFIVSAMAVCLFISSLINIWCLYTYVGDLDSTKCSCAIDKQKNTHYFLYLWRYILVGIVILALLGIISGAIFSKNITITK